MKKFFLFMLANLLTISMLAQISIVGPRGTYGESKQGRGGEVNLYSQMIPHPFYGAIASQEFPDFGNARLQSADDFIVPAAGWDLSRVEALGVYFDGTGPSDSYIIEIFADDSGLPASTPLFTQSGLSYTEVTGLFSITLSSPIHLDAGHYWISIMSYMYYSAGGQFGWQQANVPQIGYEYANRDPSNFIPLQWDANWTSGSVIIPAQDSYDFCFALYGELSGPAVPISNWAIYLGILLIAAFMVVTYRRRMA